jgi:hypothetical protein
MKVTPLALYLLASNLFLIGQGVHATHEGTIPPLGSSPSGNTNDDFGFDYYCKKVCADGSMPLNLDAQLGLNVTGYNIETFEYDYLSNLTCGNAAQAYLEKYNIFAYDYQCGAIRFAGFERCGCPDLRVNPCNLCEDEKDEFDPDSMIPDIFEGGGEITCFQLAAFISLNSNETCSAYQATVGERCGCSKVPNLQCPSLCGPGNAIPDPGRMFDGETCDTLELFTTIIREINGCGFFGGDFAIVSEYCCADEAGPTSSPTETPLCPATPCADGSSSPLNLADVELGLNLTLYNFNDTGTGGYEYVSDLTCGNVQDFIEKNSIPNNSFNCDEITYAATVRCECPRQDNDECYLCEDEQSAFNAQTPAPVGFGYDTCLDLALGALYFSPANSSYCSGGQATVGEYCGCSNPIARAALECTLCGDNAIPDPSRMFAGSSCAYWEFYAVRDCNYTLSENSWYMPAIEYCCVEEAAPTAAPSELPLCNATPCVDGSFPTLSLANIELGLNLTVFNYTTFTYEYVTDLTCGNVQDYIEKNNIRPYQYECDQIEFAGITQCGCPDLRVNACDLCEDNNSKFEPTKESPYEYYSTCLDYAYSVSTYDNYSCPLIQATLGEYCGCLNPVARAALECPLCGPGTKVPDPSRMFSGQNCAVWEYDFSIYSYCTLSDNFLDAAEYCCAEDAGPTGSPTEAPLCPAMPCADGSIPPPSFAEVELGVLSEYGLKLTCSNVHGFIEDFVITQSSYECGHIELAGILKCGCSDLRVGACNLCEDGMDLFNLDSPSPFSSNTTCFEEAASVASLLDDSFCAVAQATLGEHCGCSNPVARATLVSPLCGRGNALPDPFRTFGGSTCAEHEYYQQPLFFNYTDPDVVEYCCAEEEGPTGSPTEAPLCSATPCSDGSVPPLDVVNVKLGITLEVFDYATNNNVRVSNLKCGGTSVQDFIEKYSILGYYYECEEIRLAGIEKCGCPSSEIGPVGNEPSLTPVIEPVLTSSALVTASPTSSAPVYTLPPTPVPSSAPVTASPTSSAPVYTLPPTPVPSSAPVTASPTSSAPVYTLPLTPDPPTNSSVSVPALGPPLISKGICEDSPPEDRFLEHNGRLRNCAWLSLRTRRVEQHCKEGELAYTKCEETCGLCSDTCEDSLTESFEVENETGFYNCNWLKTKPRRVADLCIVGHKAFEVCKETCENC